MWLEEYKRSLKMSEAEEVFDLILYRPIAFLFVKLIYRLPITPNQVTMLSLIAGLIAARYFSVATSIAFALAGIWYGIANILDCCDGQLARLQNSGTLLGRIIDGVVDYISSIAIFIAIGVGLSGSGQSVCGLVILAGISSAFHAIFFDYYQNEYISTVRAEYNFLEKEIERFTLEIRRMTEEHRNSVKLFFLRIYLRYLRLQQQASTKSERQTFHAENYRRHNRLMIRLWSFLGPTTNRTLLIACSLVGSVKVFLWMVAIGGNVWLIACYCLQRNIHRKLELAQP